MIRPLLVLLGPTGSGKSDLALFLASLLPCEIVSCDSLQIYRGFDIGTAKVGAGLRDGVPHHLIDIASPREAFSAGDYARIARPLLVEISSRGRIPVVTGGTGFYLRALLYGLADAPARDEALRARLSAREARSPNSLHRILRRLDRKAAERIHSNDTHKLIRALEITIRSRRTLSEIHAAPPTPLAGFDTLKLGLNPSREELRKALDLRASRMFESGLIEEVQALLASGLTGNEKPFESLGYKQALTVIRSQATLAEAIEST
ncbi:MAG: tRNA (adenosine(37)-N6)-dimethylallyltransferase MiaA, partial [Bryobacteraceae bacterium]